MATKKGTRKKPDPAEQYIDSPLMSYRVRYGKYLSARMDGNYGIYRTMTMTGKQANGSCSCPSDYWPCKHIRALKATWRENPGSFVDIQKVLSGLSSRTNKDLLEIMAQMALNAPESLRALGVKDFDEDED